jgi:hypothetical protein
LQLANIKTLTLKLEDVEKKIEAIQQQYEQVLRSGLTKEKIITP